VRSALATVPAAYATAIVLDRDEVYVSYDRSAGDAKAAAAPMIKAIQRAGFDPWLKGEGWPAEVGDVAVLPGAR
jgi:hypothetical protein